MSLPIALAMLAAAVLVTVGTGLAIVGAMVLAWADGNRLTHAAAVSGIAGGLAAFIAGMSIVAGNLL